VEEEGEGAAKAVEASSGGGAPSKLMELGGRCFGREASGGVSAPAHIEGGSVGRRRGSVVGKAARCGYGEDGARGKW
jgi:hypothetical protein